MAEPKPKLCTYPSCETVVKPGVLACRPHWFELSARLRDRLVFAWEQRKAHPDIPELVNIHRALLFEALREWKIPPEVIAREIKARAPKTIDPNCPFCGMPGPMHRPGCRKLN